MLPGPAIRGFQRFTLVQDSEACMSAKVRRQAILAKQRMEPWMQVGLGQTLLCSFACKARARQLTSQPIRLLLYPGFCQGDLLRVIHPPFRTFPSRPTQATDRLGSYTSTELFPSADRLDL
jgi:hypothetical protein